MGTEIERKFLVQGDAWRSGAATRMCQGYLCRDVGSTVRVRTVGNQAFLTIKGESKGATRAEFEYPIPLADAEQLLSMCDGPLIDKTRYTLNHVGMLWEVDEFHGSNAGLVVAEIELAHEDQAFDLPPWTGREVTGDARYFNSNLAVRPYSTWGGS